MSTDQDTKVKETEPQPHTTIAHVVQSITRGKQSLPQKPPVPLLGMASLAWPGATLPVDYFIVAFIGNT